MKERKRGISPAPFVPRYQPARAPHDQACRLQTAKTLEEMRSPIFSSPTFELAMLSADLFSDIFVCPPREVPEHEQFAQRYANAWCSQNAASVAAFFAEHGSLTINNGTPSVGRSAITAAAHAQKAFAQRGLSDRRAAIETIRSICRDQAEPLGREEFEETRIGRLEHKIDKLRVVANRIPGVEWLTTRAFSGEDGIALEEYAPFGVIAAVTFSMLIAGAVFLLAACTGGDASPAVVVPPTSMPTTTSRSWGLARSSSRWSPRSTA